MIIKRINLRNFGKFKDKELLLNNGLNIIYGENGSGKSTFSTALKTFFYTAGKIKNKYKRNYIPIGEQKGTFDILADINGEETESFVTLGKTEAKTFVKTINNSTGEELDTNGIDLGEYLFKIDEEMFDSVCFLKDLSGFNAVKENKESVSEELSKANSATVIDVDVSEVLKKMDADIKRYSRSTVNGLIHPLDKRLLEIEKTLSDIDEIKENIKDIKKDRENLLKSLESKEEYLKDLKAKKEYAQKFEEYKLAKKQIELREKIKELEEKIEKTKIEKPLIPDDEIELLKKHKDASFSKLKGGKTSLVAGAILFILTFALLFASYLFSPLFAVGAFLMVKGISDNKKYNTVKYEEEKISGILKKYDIDGIEDYNYKLKTAEKNEYELKIAEKEISYLKENVKEYKKEYEGVYLEKPEYELSFLISEEERITKDIFDIKLEETKLKEQEKNAFNNLPDFGELLKEKEELLKKLTKLKCELEVAQDAYEILLKTSKSFKSSYIPYLNSKVKEILNEILPKKADYFAIKDNFRPEVRLQDEEDIKDEENLSSGTGDLINFAIRLAVYSLVCEDKEIPLILDDCFIELDDERFEKIMVYLHKKFKNQIIYFTAHKRIFNLTLENNPVIVI